MTVAEEVVHEYRNLRPHEGESVDDLLRVVRALGIEYFAVLPIPVGRTAPDDFVVEFADGSRVKLRLLLGSKSILLRKIIPATAVPAVPMEERK